MGYFGRICIPLTVVLIVAVWHASYFILNQHESYAFFIRDGFLKYDFIYTPPMLPFFWWLGKKYDQVVFYSQRDPLTSLYNRRYFSKELQKEITQAKISKKSTAVMFIDLDRFKFVNDTLGHDKGDGLLRDVARRLTNTIAQRGTISRMGGDEFTIILPGMTEDECHGVAQHILKQLSEPFLLDNQEVFATSSIGISIFPEHGDNLDDLVKKADSAMYLAKERGRNNYQFYSSELGDTLSYRVNLEHQLRKALQNHEFRVNYQPIVELDTGKVVGLEALLRWHHPIHGLVSPKDFIPLAEETGLIIPIGRWVLNTVCHQNKAWQEAGFPPLYMSVNVSARQMNPDFARTVEEVLKESQMDPKFLYLEITESIMQDAEYAIPILNQLKALGIQIAVDDFGTGFSSLSYLQHLPIDYIKVDKSFVDNLLDSDNGVMVKTIIDMGRNLNLRVVAEGIEHQTQVSFLVQNQCTFGQGYFYSKPLSVEDVEAQVFPNSHKLLVSN